jgi:RNA polymerase sigma-70 factor (ECF subfamily)
MASQSDYEVIRESLRSPAAVGEIFVRHAHLVYRYVRRRVGEDLAADVTAEVFTRAFRDRPRFDGRSGSSVPWLLGIATNVVRMNARGEHRRLKAYARVAATERPLAWALDIDARLDAEALGPALADALAALPPRQRDVLLLHAWAELAPAEIATALAMAPGTVRSDLHRARGFVEARLPMRTLRGQPDVEQMT